MPVPGLPALPERLQEPGKILICREFFEPLPILESQPHPFLDRVRQQFPQTALRLLPEGRPAPAQFFQDPGETPLVARYRRRRNGGMPADKLAQSSRWVEPEKAHASQMHDHGPRPHLRREIERAPAMPQPLFLLVSPAGRGGWFEKVGRRMGHARGQWAEIVGRADLDDSFAKCLQNPRHQGKADTVAQLHKLKPEAGHFRQHRLTFLVTGRAPCGREGNDGRHGRQRRHARSWPSAHQTCAPGARG